MRLISNVVRRTATEQFEERYARVFLAMSLEQAKETLGFSARANPSKEEIVKAYRTKAIENHPDRGGDLEKMVSINVAKDILEGKARPSAGGSARSAPNAWRPEAAPPRPKPEPPKVVGVVEGETFDSATKGMDPPVEIKFTSKVSYGSTRPTDDAEASFSYDMFLIYGQSKTHHIFMGLRHRQPKTFYSAMQGGVIEVKESWESLVEMPPISKDLAKIAAPAIRRVMTTWLDKLKPMKQLKYITWPGGRLTEATILKIKFSGYAGGAPLKDVLLGLNLVGEEVGKGRKTNIEMYYRNNKEKWLRVSELRKQDKRVSYWLGYDWFVRVNGTEYLLSERTVENLIKALFIGWVIDDKIKEGQPKNLTKIRGGVFRYSPGEVIKRLADNLTSEPTGLVLALSKAAEEWGDEQAKKAAMRQLVACEGIEGAADLSGIEPYEVLQAWV